MQSPITSNEAARIAAEAALSRKALNVAVLDLRGIASFTDFFVICSGTSDMHAEGLAEIVREKMKDAGQKLMGREGRKRGDWTLLDYIDIVVHIFVGETRELYGLERLWADAPSEQMSGDDIPVDPEWKPPIEEEERVFTARDF